MRYRKLDANGDYSFGQGLANFWIDVPAAVAQAIQTRLLLWQGEWFLDTAVGLPIAQKILGYGTRSLYDTAIKDVILNTPGVTSIVAGTYSSTSDPTTRKLTVNAQVQTQFSVTPISVGPVVI